MASSGDYFLTEDLVIGILSRLPVKSLLRFKCVCKHWYALIKSPSFISHHHHNNRTQLLVHNYTADTEEIAFALFPDETLATRQNLDYLQMPTNITTVVGPVNGLFLLHKEWNGHATHLALWNPATREFRTLPELDSNLPRCFRAYLNDFGFGLDPLTNDYKVIWIRYFWNEKLGASHDPPVVGVYTLGIDSWRHLDPDPDTANSLSNLSYSSIYVDGAHYWLSYDDINFTVVRFDMGNEVFRVIQAPPVSPGVEGCLSLHNDSLALIFCKRHVQTLDAWERGHEGCWTVDVDVWVMEEEGCWTKHFSIGSLPNICDPLGLWKNNELFFKSKSSQLILYNLNSHEIRNIGVRGCETKTQSLMVVFKYKESLVSVNVGNKNSERHSLSDILEDFVQNVKVNAAGKY